MFKLPSTTVIRSAARAHHSKVRAWLRPHQLACAALHLDLAPAGERLGTLLLVPMHSLSPDTPLVSDSFYPFVTPVMGQLRCNRNSTEIKDSNESGWRA